MAVVRGRRRRAVWERHPGAMLVLSLALSVAGCKADLYSRLTEREGNLIVATLLHSGIAADRFEAKDGSSIVRVEQDRFADAVMLLNAAGLPRAKFETMGSIFSSNGLVSSPTEERARLVHALNQELARTVTEIDGVLSARVHVVLPKNDPLRHDQAPSAASVFIKYDARTEVTSLLPQIKTLVANSIEGLTYDKVAVVFVRGDPEVFAIAPTAAAETTASVRSYESGIVERMHGGVGLALAAGGGVVGSAGLFWLWRRTRGAAVRGAVPTGQGDNARIGDRIRAVS